LPAVSRSRAGSAVERFAASARACRENVSAASCGKIVDLCHQALVEIDRKAMFLHG
jgi:hypothetical protein